MFSAAHEGGGGSEAIVSSSMHSRSHHSDTKFFGTFCPSSRRPGRLGAQRPPGGQGPAQLVDGQRLPNLHLAVLPGHRLVLS